MIIHNPKTDFLFKIIIDENIHRTYLIHNDQLIWNDWDIENGCKFINDTLEGICKGELTIIDPSDTFDDLNKWVMH